METATSVANDNFNIEERRDHCRWTFITPSGAYLLRFLQMGPYSVSEVGSRVVGDANCIRIADDFGTEPDAWANSQFRRNMPRLIK
jgi:hypothetical protein